MKRKSTTKERTNNVKKTRSVTWSDGCPQTEGYTTTTKLSEPKPIKKDKPPVYRYGSCRSCYRHSRTC